ncbi:hypothetical protein ABE28_009925 [Peribacillus muralis]|uniref:DUF2642 domain-containing protein n=1 Tax=Peribacillus muralis TaxID=264697 RepID=A0A1B3XN86_9BACI|nr:hypothetical protein [Peribacillus muralis]AOH54667.1 hypothetical protein ABE28_009925 [Peribacillus muralis]
MNRVEREIESIEVMAGADVSTISIGNEVGGEVIADIIQHDGVYKLYNRRDELIIEINLPVVSVKY